MQSLIIADDLHQGQFVLQGLKYESIPCSLLSVHTPPVQIRAAVGFADCVFVLTTDIAMISSLLPLCKIEGKKIPVVLLATHYSQDLYDFFQESAIERFFVRPFPFRSIAGEVRSLVFLSREPSTCQTLRVRDLELNRDTHEVHWKGQQIHLRNKEFVLLEFLMLNSGKLLSREIILETVWDRNANIFTNTVDVHINKLRKKIDYQVSEKFIRTVYCSGYIFS